MHNIHSTYTYYSQYYTMHNTTLQYTCTTVNLLCILQSMHTVCMMCIILICILLLLKQQYINNTTYTSGTSSYTKYYYYYYYQLLLQYSGVLLFVLASTSSYMHDVCTGLVSEALWILYQQSMRSGQTSTRHRGSKLLRMHTSQQLLWLRFFNVFVCYLLRAII